VLELIAVDIDGEYAFVLNEYSDFVPPGMEGKRVVLVSVLDDREDEGVVFAEYFDKTIARRVMVDVDAEHVRARYWKEGRT